MKKLTKEPYMKKLLLGSFMGICISMGFTSCEFMEALAGAYSSSPSYSSSSSSSSDSHSASDYFNDGYDAGYNGYSFIDFTSTEYGCAELAGKRGYSQYRYNYDLEACYGK